MGTSLEMKNQKALHEPRPYQSEIDLDRMRSLLQVGRQAANGTYYVHIGDLNWWLYYPPLDHDLWQYIHLWDDPANPDRLLGWSLLSPQWSAFDVVVQPELRGTPLAETMYTWAEGQISNITRTRGKDRIYVMWVSQGDDVLNNLLQRHGFQRTPDDVAYMTRSMEEPIPVSDLSEGYRVCSVGNKVEERAAAQYGAFESGAPIEVYLQRYCNFMHAPIYDPELDVVVVAPDGRVGAFCIAWLDPVNQIGLFEPVGTHPDFRQRGLGKAVMFEALRRLRERGMTSAIVCTNQNNLPAMKLYEAVGFRTADVHLTYKKDIS
jgi:ribosomal protein S18 acetylase RimI-like enzyme